MAHRDPQSTVVMVDLPEALEAANSTAQAIEIGDRVSKMEGDPDDVELPQKQFDLALIAQRISSRGDEQAQRMVQRAADSVVPGGRVVVVDLFQTPGPLQLSEAIESLKLNLGTRSGRVRHLNEMQGIMAKCGLKDLQFTYLAASHVNLGMAVGRKQAS